MIKSHTITANVQNALLRTHRRDDNNKLSFADGNETVRFCDFLLFPFSVASYVQFELEFDRLPVRLIQIRDFYVVKTRQGKPNGREMRSEKTTKDDGTSDSTKNQSRKKNWISRCDYFLYTKRKNMTMANYEM